MKNNITWYNKNFRFVFESKSDQFPRMDCIGNMIGFTELPGKRFLIGAGQISKYITEKNAETVLKTAENMKTDKTTIKFRKYGKIEIYTK